MSKTVVAGFTGTQLGMTDIQKETVREILSKRKVTEFHHGDCIGADTEAHNIARKLGIRTVIHPPLESAKRAYNKGWKIMGKKEYLDRDHDIVDACDFLIACPKNNFEILRSGTWATVRYARKVEKNILLILPFKENSK